MCTGMVMDLRPNLKREVSKGIRNPRVVENHLICTKYSNSTGLEILKLFFPLFFFFVVVLFSPTLNEQ